MAIIQWDPFQDFERMFPADWPSMTFPKSSLLTAPLDIYEKENDVVVEMLLPGVSQKDVEITVEGDLLRVFAVREEKKEIDKKNYISKEIRRGSFERIVRLPAVVESGATHAEMKEGTLIITLPKQKNAKSAAVKIKIK